MCGIVGTMGLKLGLQDIQKFKDLFLLAQLRGEDGAGMIAVPNKSPVQSVRVKRTTWSSGHLITTSDFTECIKGDTNILIGHARQPTRGGTKIENVHPHRSGNIILVHNGTMTYVGDSSIPAGESDSKLVTKAIAERGPKGFADTSWGAYCLVWVDLGNQTLNFLRNNERPLWMCEERSTILGSSPASHVWWASESWMIQTALGRYTGYNKDRHKYFPLPINEHWAYPLDVRYQLNEPEITKCEKRTYSVVGYSGTDTWESWVGEDQTPKKDTVPFVVGGGGANTSGNNAATTNKDKPFTYIPPEHRGGLPKNTGVDNTGHRQTTPAVVAGAVFLRSKQDALLATAAAEKKGQDSQSAVIFPRSEARDLDYYACKETKRITDMVAHAPCVWCNLKPQYRRENGETVPPRIFPVRFTDTRGEYVCEECIKDLDVQRMVGVAC